MLNEDIWRWLKTAAVMLASMNAGTSTALFGITFPDMAILVSVTNGQMATTLTWIGLSSIVGTLCMGPLFDRFDGLILLSSGLLLQGVATTSAPWCRILTVFQVLAGLASLFSTGILTGCLCVNSAIWKKKSEMINPIIQLTVLTYTLGAAITPQMIASFIGTLRLPDVVGPTATPPDQDIAHSSTEGNESTASNSSSRSDGTEPVQIAYFLLACINSLSAVVCFAICAVEHAQKRVKSNEYLMNRQIVRRRRSYPSSEEERTIVDEELIEEPLRERAVSLDRKVFERKFDHHRTRLPDRDEAYIPQLLLKRQELQHRKEFFRRRSTGNVSVEADTTLNNTISHEVVLGNSNLSVTCSRKVIPLFAIVMLFTTLNGCLDAMFGGLLFTFLNGYLHWTPRDGTLLVTFYKVTCLVVHGVVVILSRFTSPIVLLLVDLVILVVSTTLMLVAIDARQVFIAIAVILASIGTSNLHSTSLTLVQRSFQVDGKVFGMLIGATFLGYAAVSPVAGLLLDFYGAVSFPAVLLSITALEMVFFALWLIAARVVRGQHEPQVEEIVIVNDQTPLIGQR